MRVIFLCVTVMAATTICHAYDFSTNPGDGSVEHPYEISEPNQLNAIGSDATLLTKCYILMNDIDMAEYTGTSFNQIGNSSIGFSGVFNGNNMSITNFTYTGNGEDYIGIFDTVEGSTTYIYDVNMVNPVINYGTGQYVGTLVGRMDGGRIESCHVSGGSITGTGWSAGGLIGFNVGGTVIDSHAFINVTGGDYTGGLIGYNYHLIEHCSALGIISGKGYVGGLAGVNEGNISRSYFTGNVTGTSDYIGGLVGFSDSSSSKGFILKCSSSGSVSGHNNVGGLVGFLMRSIRESFSTSTVTGNEDIGGLVGDFTGWDITDCYAWGNVEGNKNAGGLAGMADWDVIRCYSVGKVICPLNAGGLIGIDYGDEVHDSYWDTETSGTTSSDGGIGLDDPNMMIQANFVGWDFVGESANGENEIWRMCVDGVDYARLSWEFARNGDFACGDGVDILDLQALGQNWLSAADSTPTTFNYACDANGDEVIDFLDYAVLGENW